MLKDENLKLLFKSMNYVAVLICLSVSYYRLTSTLTKYHPNDYCSLKKKLKKYFLLEFVSYLLISMEIIILAILKSKVLGLSISIFNILSLVIAIEILFFPLVQAFIVCEIKCHLDILQGISKLNMMMVVSIRQVITYSFLPTMIKDDSWKKIDVNKR